jgi:hypothetical protein
MSEKFRIPKAHHTEALRHKECMALCVVFLLLCVLAAIQFDDEPGFDTYEVGDVIADGMLPLELVAAQPAVAYQPPELLFGVGWHMAHGLRERAQRCAVLAIL